MQERVNEYTTAAHAIHCFNRMRKKHMIIPIHTERELTFHDKNQNKILSKLGNFLNPIKGYLSSHLIMKD